IHAVALTAYPVLAVIAFAIGAGFIPFRKGHVAVVGMDGIEPAISFRLLVGHAGIGLPLRRRPCALALRGRAEDKMGHGSRQQAKALLAFHERHLVLTAQGHVLPDLEEAFRRSIRILERPDTAL